METQIGRREISGPTEADPEYKVIVNANNIIVEIDNEISKNFTLTKISFCKRTIAIICVYIFLQISFTNTFGIFTTNAFRNWNLLYRCPSNIFEQ